MTTNIAALAIAMMNSRPPLSPALDSGIRYCLNGIETVKCIEIVLLSHNVPYWVLSFTATVSSNNTTIAMHTVTGIINCTICCAPAFNALYKTRTHTLYTFHTLHTHFTHCTHTSHIAHIAHTLHAHFTHTPRIPRCHHLLRHQSLGGVSRIHATRPSHHNCTQTYTGSTQTIFLNSVLLAKVICSQK